MCFICGLQNPIGLKLAFYEDAEAGQVRAEFTVPDEYQGYPAKVFESAVKVVVFMRQLTIEGISFRTQIVQHPARMKQRFQMVVILLDDLDATRH